ncbi:hypothetical protein [Aliarcobacter butzleri]|uniref:hypothetical protein n=1 Tax=Aliarcobacter butzleri TaxID=28197 RepID=UPI001260725C|nr:hypothetical protein [Aliarcobacter butzleri]
MTLGQIWYYMIYLSNNDSVKFWGKIEYFINSGNILTMYFLIGLFVIPISIYTISGITKISKRWSFIIGMFLVMFVFQSISSHSSNIRILIMEEAKKVYEEDKSKFENWEQFIK